MLLKPLPKVRIYSIQDHKTAVQFKEDISFRTQAQEHIFFYHFTPQIQTTHTRARTRARARTHTHTQVSEIFTCEASGAGAGLNNNTSPPCNK